MGKNCANWKDVDWGSNAFVVTFLLDEIFHFCVVPVVLKHYVGNVGMALHVISIFKLNARLFGHL